MHLQSKRQLPSHSGKLELQEEQDTLVCKRGPQNLNDAHEVASKIILNPKPYTLNRVTFYESNTILNLCCALLKFGSITLRINMLVSQNLGYLFGGPYNKD